MSTKTEQQLEKLKNLLNAPEPQSATEYDDWYWELAQLLPVIVATNPVAAGSSEFMFIREVQGLLFDKLGKDEAFANVSRLRGIIDCYAAAAFGPPTEPEDAASDVAKAIYEASTQEEPSTYHFGYAMIAQHAARAVAERDFLQLASICETLLLLWREMPQTVVIVKVKLSLRTRLWNTLTRRPNPTIEVVVGNRAKGQYDWLLVQMQKLMGDLLA